MEKKKKTSQFKNKTKKLPPRLKKNIFLRVKICEVGKLMFSLKSKKGTSNFGWSTLPTQGVQVQTGPIQGAVSHTLSSTVKK